MKKLKRFQEEYAINYRHDDGKTEVSLRDVRKTDRTKAWQKNEARGNWRVLHFYNKIIGTTPQLNKIYGSSILSSFIIEKIHNLGK